MNEYKNFQAFALLVLGFICIVLFSSCATNKRCTPRCIVYTKGSIVEIDRPVRLEIKREGFDVTYRDAYLVNGQVYYEGKPLQDSFEFSDATVRIMEKD